MAEVVDYKDAYIKGLSLISGIEEEKIREYAKNNNPINILIRPKVIEPDSKQLKKLKALNEFIASYNNIQSFGINKIFLNSSSEAGSYFSNILSGKKDKEVFMAAFLDTQNNIIETRILSKGTINEAVIYPREVLKQALDCECNSIIFAHNHPGGSLNPSQADIGITQRMINIFKPLSINVLDHVIVGDNGYHSMAENGEIPHSVEEANYDTIKLWTKTNEDVMASYGEDFEFEL